MDDHADMAAGPKRKRNKSVWRMFLLLMWKNLLLRKRHWFLTTFEIFLPTLLFTLLLTIRVLPDSAFQPVHKNETRFNVTSELKLKEELCQKYGVWAAYRCVVPDNVDFVQLENIKLEDLIGLGNLDLEELSGIGDLNLGILSGLGNLTLEDLIGLGNLTVGDLSGIGNLTPEDLDDLDLNDASSLLETIATLLDPVDPSSLVDLDLSVIKDLIQNQESQHINNTFPEFPEGSNFSYPGERKIFYGPGEGFALSVAKHVADMLHLGHHVLTPAASNKEMDSLVDQAYFSTNDSWAAFYVGLFFHDLDDPENDVPPERLNYDLRLGGVWATDLLYPFLQIPGPRNFSFILESYSMDGFVLLQSTVDRYYISRLTNSSRYSWLYRMETQMYPYPEYMQDYAVSQFYGSALPTFVVLSLVLLSPSLIKSVVHEKETGVRELISLMGLERWLVWLGWFLHSFVIIIIVATIMTLLLKLQVTPLDYEDGYLPPIIIYTDPFFLWVMLVLYGISSIAFCFAVSTFFSRPTLATTLGILLWMTSYFLPRQMMDFDYNTMGLTPKVLSCLLPNMAITWAFRIIAMFEGKALGVQWDNLWDTGNPRDQLTPALILIMLAVDVVVYLLITWYVDHISPGVYGVPLPWYFPFQKTYWCGAPPPQETKATKSSSTDENFEQEPEGLKPGIIVKNLRKEFRSLGGETKVAVEDVSLRCYEGQCTVLLGHNGAGKTTTMSVITGVYAPSGGHVEVSGWDIATHLKKAREEIGLCPQHNMLFVDLTVLQHLIFFGRLKGLTRAEAREEAEELMTRLELKAKKHMFGDQLSGGMKRKLCLAIALIGGSKVVILDEPSSGLDPESRRWVWEAVQGERGRRTVLVTTHHMEEADVLGDRVAIMAAGRVVCAGSTLFLKNKFGDGYTLTINVKGGTKASLKDEVLQFIPDAKLKSARGGEVTFRLPPTPSLFGPLLDGLTKKKGELGIGHVGLSLTSMEQVFLRVGAEMDCENESVDRNGSLYDKAILDPDVTDILGAKQDSDLATHQYSSNRFLFNSQAEVDVRLTGGALLRHQIRAFFVKRWIYSKRKWILLLTQGLLPVLITIMCLLVDASFNEDTFQESPRELTMTMFPHTSSFVHADTRHTHLAEAYQQLFYDPYTVNHTDNVIDSLLEEAEENLYSYRENSVFSAEYLDGSLGVGTSMRILYQSVPYHAPGISASMATNALLHHATASNYSITTTNRPLPPNRTWKIGNTGTSGSAFVYAMMMPLALAFLSASFLVFPLQERETKAKQVQVMTGAPVWALWSTTFVFDLLTYLVSALAVFMFLMLLDFKDNFTVDAGPGVVVLLLVLYGWGSIPMAYLFSMPFRTAASGFAVMALVNIVAGQIITTAVWALDLSEQPDLVIVSDVLHWVTSLIPAYPAATAFLHIVETSSYNKQCDQFNATIKLNLCNSLADILPYSDFMVCCPMCAEVGNQTCFEKRSYFLMDESGVGPSLLTLFLNGVVFIAALTVLESNAAKVFRGLWWRLVGGCRAGGAREAADAALPEDEDVVGEAALVDTMLRARQQHGGSDDATLLVSGLTKQFPGSVSAAVDHISLRVGRGECVGLLGVNGAGKTTTFRMLTGDEEPSAGEAMIENTPLSRNKNMFVQQIGYCPQFDAVLGELTGLEMLTLMGRLRGLADSRMRRMVSELVDLVGLAECAARPCSTYSGGNRRKLSTAMALLGSPPLVFLDEPTSGVDPASRRRVWSAVTQAVRNGQSVVLTSHSMEECEALCSRIIIMSRGNLRCVGTMGHLKEKFGQGYSVQIKLRSLGTERTGSDDGYTTKVDQLKKAVTYNLRGAVLVDQHKGLLAYRVPNKISWGHLFSVLECLKQGRQPGMEGTSGDTAPSPSIIEDYAASDTSLEQVFLSFAREANAAAQNKGIPNEVITKF